MALRYFTFAGKDSRSYFTFINKISRPYLPPMTVPSFTIPNKAGAIALKRNDIGVREIEIEVTLMADSNADLRSRVRKLSEFLYYNVDQELIFSDEVNRKYYARFNSSSTDLEELAYIGEGKLSFTCFDPLAYSTVENTLLMGKQEIFTTNYAEKVSGSLTENANRVLYTTTSPASALVLPSAAGLTEPTTTAYGFINVNGDYDTLNLSTAVSGNNAQVIFRFDVITALEKKYGTTFWKGKTTLADKLAWAKKNLTQLAGQIYGRGNMGATNLLTLGIFNASTGAYSATTITNTTGALASLYLPTTNFDAFIGSDGYISFIAYSPASDGVSTSNAYIDFAQLEISANVQQNEITITNNGSFRLFPRLRVLPTVDCTFIKWTNVTTGKSITYNATWKALEALVIDTGTNQVYRDADKVNFIKNIALDSTFFPLEIGANIIRIENQNIDSTGVNNQARVYWTERFL
jgi:predicted phage tail component-like protein